MRDEAEARAAIVAEAKSWLGTRYHHHARVKGVGCDCAQLPAAVYEAVGLIPHLEPQYSPQWMLHRDEEQYLAWIRPHARAIERTDVRAGDLAVYKFGRTFSHSAIVIDPPTIIHAMQRAGSVVLADMDRDGELAGRPVLYFSLFGAHA